MKEVLLAQSSLYVHKNGLKPDSFHFITFEVSNAHSSWNLNYRSQLLLNSYSAGIVFRRQILTSKVNLRTKNI